MNHAVGVHISNRIDTFQVFHVFARITENIISVVILHVYHVDPAVFVKYLVFVHPYALTG